MQTFENGIHVLIMGLVVTILKYAFVFACFCSRCWGSSNSLSDAQCDFGLGASQYVNVAAHQKMKSQAKAEQLASSMMQTSFNTQELTMKHTNAPFGIALFVAGLEDTGHHMIGEIMENSEYVVGLPKVTLSKKDKGRICEMSSPVWDYAHVPSEYALIAKGNNASFSFIDHNSSIIPVATIEESSNFSRCVYRPPLPVKEIEAYAVDIFMKAKANNSKISVLLLNTQWGFMGSYPARLMGTSPDMTKLQEIFSGSVLSFRVLQLSRELNSYLSGALHYDSNSIKKHAQVVAKHGSFMADQLEKISLRNRCCVKYDRIPEYAHIVQRMLGVLDFFALTNRYYRPSSRKAHHFKNLPASVVEVHERLTGLCAESLATIHHMSSPYELTGLMEN